MGFLFENLTSDEMKDIFDNYSVALQRLNLMTQKSTGNILTGKQMAFLYVHPECNHGLSKLGRGNETQSMLNNYAVVSNARPEGHPVVRLVNSLKSGVIARMLEGEKGNWREDADNGGVLNDPTRIFMKKASALLGAMKGNKFTTEGQGLDPNEIAKSLSVAAKTATDEVASLRNDPNASEEEIATKTNAANLISRVSAEMNGALGSYEPSMLFGYQDPAVEERVPYASKTVPTADEWEMLQDTEKWLYFFVTNINAALGITRDSNAEDANTLYYLVKEFENTLGSDENVKFFLDKLIEMNSNSVNVQGEDIELKTSSSPGQLVAAMLMVPSIKVDKTTSVSFADKLADKLSAVDPEHADVYKDAAKKITDFGNNVINKAVFPGQNIGKKTVREKLGSILTNKDMGVLELPNVKSSSVHDVVKGYDLDNNRGFTPVINSLIQQANAGDDDQMKVFTSKLTNAKNAIKILGRLFDNPGSADELGDDAKGGKDNYIGADAASKRNTRAAMGTTPFASTSNMVSRFSPSSIDDWAERADQDVAVKVIDPQSETGHLKGAKAIPEMAIPLFATDIKIKPSGDAQVDQLVTKMVAAGLYIIMKETEGRLVNMPNTLKGEVPSLGTPTITQDREGNAVASWPQYNAGARLTQSDVANILDAVKECFAGMKNVPGNAVTARNAWIKVLDGGNPRAAMEQIYDSEVNDELRGKIAATKESPIADALDIIRRHVLNVKKNSRNLSLSCGNVDMGAPMYTMNTDEHGKLRLTAGGEGTVNKVGNELYRSLRGTVQRVGKTPDGETTYQLDMAGIPPFRVTAENSEDWVAPMLVPVMDRDTDETSYCLLSGIHLFSEFTEEGPGFSKIVNPDVKTASNKSFEETPTVFGDGGMGGIDSLKDMSSSYDPYKDNKYGKLGTAGIETMTAGAIKSLGMLRSADPKSVEKVTEFFTGMMAVYRRCVDRAKKLKDTDPDNPVLERFDRDNLLDSVNLRNMVNEYVSSGRDINGLVNYLKGNMAEMLDVACALGGKGSSGMGILAELPVISNFVNSAKDATDRANRQFAVLSGLVAMGDDGVSCVGRHMFIVSFDGNMPRFTGSNNVTFGTRRQESDQPNPAASAEAKNFEAALDAAKACVANRDMSAVDGAFNGLMSAYPEVVKAGQSKVDQATVDAIATNDPELNNALANIMPIVEKAYRRAPELGEIDAARAFAAAFSRSVVDDNGNVTQVNTPTGAPGSYATSDIAGEVGEAHRSANKFDETDRLDDGDYDQFADVDPDVVRSMAGEDFDYDTPFLDEAKLLDEDVEYDNYIGQFKGMPVLGYVKASDSAVHGDTLDVEKGFTPDDMVTLATTIDDAHHFLQEHRSGVRIPNQKIRERELQVHWAFDLVIDSLYRFFSAETPADALDIYTDVKRDFDVAVKEAAKVGVHSFLQNAKNSMDAFIEGMVGDAYQRETPAQILSDIATCFANVVMYIGNLDVLDRGFDETNSLGEYGAGGKDKGKVGLAAKVFSANEPTQNGNTIGAHVSSSGLDLANDTVVRQTQGSLVGANGNTPEFTAALNNLYERARLGDTAGFETSIDKFGDIVKKSAEKSRLTKRSLYLGLNGSQLMSAFVDAIIRDENAGENEYPTVEGMVQSLHDSGTVNVPSYLASRLKVDSQKSLASAGDIVTVGVDGSGAFLTGDNTNPTRMNLRNILNACGMKGAVPGDLSDLVRMIRVNVTEKYLKYGPFGKNDDKTSQKMFLDSAEKLLGEDGFVPLDVIFAATTPHILNMAHNAAVGNAAATLQGMAAKDTAGKIAKSVFGVSADDAASNAPTGVTDDIAEIIAAGREYALAMKGMGGDRTAGDRITALVGPTIGNGTLTGIVNATRDAKTPAAVKRRVDEYIKKLMRNMNGPLRNALVTPQRKNDYAKYQSASAAMRRTDYLDDNEGIGGSKLFSLVGDILSKVSVNTDVEADLQDEAESLGDYRFRFGGAERMGALEEYQSILREFAKGISSFVEAMHTYVEAQEALNSPEAAEDEDLREAAEEEAKRNAPDPNARTILSAEQCGPGLQKAVDKINKSIADFWRATGHDPKQKQPAALTGAVNRILEDARDSNEGVAAVIAKVGGLMAKAAANDTKCYAAKVPTIATNAQAHRGFSGKSLSRVDIDRILDLLCWLPDSSVSRDLDDTYVISGVRRNEQQIQAIMSDAVTQFNKAMDKMNETAGLTGDEDKDARDDVNPYFDVTLDTYMAKKMHMLDRLRLLDRMVVECSSLEPTERLTPAGITPYVAKQLIDRGFMHESTNIPNALTTVTRVGRGNDSKFPAVCTGKFRFDIPLSPYLTDIVASCLDAMDIDETRNTVWDALSKEMSKYTTSANRERSAELPEEVGRMLTPFVDRVAKELRSKIKSDMKAAVKDGTVDQYNGFEYNTPVTLPSGLVVTDLGYDNTPTNEPI